MSSPLVRLFVKDYANVRSEKVRRSYGTLSGFVGIVCNALLFGVKLTVALLSGAVSILADAFNNLSDLGSCVVTLVGFRMAGKPADKEHPFGHGRIEYLAGFVVAVVILVMGAELFITSAKKIASPETPTFTVATLVVLGACILVKLWMAFFNARLGRAVDSPIMKTTAKDSLSDCASTLAVLIGVLISYFAGVNVDAYLGIVVACFILFTGFVAAKDCLSPMLGAKPDPELIREIEEKVMSNEGVSGIHDLIVHDYGPGRKIVSLHAEVSAGANIAEIHDTIDLIERDLQKSFDCETTIHMDPIDLDDEFRAGLCAKMQECAANLDPGARIHDLRVVRGKSHTNIVFDCALPFACKKTEAEVKEYFETCAQALDPNYFTVIQVERDFTD